MAAKKRTTKKASNSIVEPKPTTSSNGRRIAILVIVVLGIVILWRNDPPADDAVNDATPATLIDETNGTDYGDDGQDLNYSPNRDYEYAPQTSGNNNGYTPQSN